MQEDEIRRKLIQLTPTERKVLSYRCQKYSNKKIATAMYGDKKDRRKAIEFHLSNIYQKLGLQNIKSSNERKFFLLIHFCPALIKMLEVEEEKAKQEKPQPEREREITDIQLIETPGNIVLINPRNLKLVRQDDEENDQAGDEMQKKAEIQKYESFPQGTKKRSNLFSFLAGFFVMALIAGGFFLYTYLRQKPILPFTLAQTSTSPNVTSTEIKETAEVTSGINPGSNSIATLTPTPTWTQIITPTFTDTLIPSSTPTETILPSPTPVVLFYDDFENGLSKQWEVISGEPLVSNGILSTNGTMWMDVGDPSWTDLKIEINISLSYNTSCGDNPFPQGYRVAMIGLRFQDIENMIALKLSSCGLEWFIAKNNQYEWLPQGGAPGPGYDNFQIITAIIQGNKFTAYVNGLGSTTFFNDLYPTGKIGLRLDPDTKVKSIKIEKLP